MNPLGAALQILESGGSLSEAEAAGAVRVMMRGEAGEEDTARFLTLLARKGETVEEIAGAALALRERASAIRSPGDAVDCCGTGGDGRDTLNISTGAAIVAAACGVPVAKHGNRASTSRAGAADVLEALGVNLDAGMDRLEAALHELNFAFLMAPRHHQAMKHVAGVRRALGFRTVFNLIGPLANPAGAKRQLLGVYDSGRIAPMAKALKRLGAQAAWVVHGEDGLDEITVAGRTDAAVLKDSAIGFSTLEPQTFGLPVSPPGALAGGDARDNAAALLSVLKGERSPYRDCIVANAAAVLVLGGAADCPLAGAAMAGEALASGAALSLLDRYIAFTKGSRP